MPETALELFRKACGLNASLALECRDATVPANPPSRHVCAHPFVLMGRDPTVDLVLDGMSVSRRHAYLQAIAGGVFCVDLESRSRTYFGGADHAQARGWLAPGQSIQVGQYDIRRTDSGPTIAPECEVLDPVVVLEDDRFACGLPRAGLELPDRTEEGPSAWHIEGLLALVGRSERCQLVLTDESISRYHASLVRTPLGVWVIDLLARQGVYVNGTRVRWAWLEDGDAVRIGRFTFLLRYETHFDEIRRADVPLEAGLIAGVPEPERRAGRSENTRSEKRAIAIRAKDRSREVIKAEPYAPASPAAAAVPGDRAEWETPALSATVLTMWQQQMQLMEAFHDDMILMVQMFMAMHREHLASVRGELDRVQQLTHELSILRAKLGETSGGDDLGRISEVGGARKELGLVRADDPESSSEASRSRGSDAGGARTRRKPRDQGGHSHSKGRSVPAAGNSAEPRADSSPAADLAASSLTVDTVELHARLTKRIAELQKERQGYWKKILRAIRK